MRIKILNKIGQISSQLPKLMIILVIISVVLGACTNTPTSVPTATSLPPTDTAAPTTNLTDYSNLPFVGVTWYWLRNELPDSSIVESNDPTRYSITFNPDGSYNGIADCNTIAGSYTVVDETLTILPGISTLMACPEESQADLFLKSLGKTSGYLLQENSLILQLRLNSGNMVFADEPTTAASVDYSQSELVGSIWNWVRAEYSNDTTVEVNSPFSYAIQFLPDGTITGTADCNKIGGTFTLAESALNLEVNQIRLLWPVQRGHLLMSLLIA